MNRVAFERADNPDLINFAVGQPDQDLIPVEALKRATAQVSRTLSMTSLNYGLPQGEPAYLEPLAEFLAVTSHRAVQPRELMLSGGTSQALDMICQAFTSPGDAVLIEDASYFLAFQIFADHGLRLIPFQRAGGSIDREALGQLIESHKPKLLYTIPFFSNPLGDSLSAEAAASLISLCEETGVLMVSDEAYQHLSFLPGSETSFASRTMNPAVLSLGTFSKMLAPGLRVGWIQCHENLRERLLDLGWVNSGGAINQWGSVLVGSILASGVQQEILENTCATLKARASVMHECLQHYLGSDARWSLPQGGYFVWVTLKAAVRTQDLLPAIREHGVGYQPGPSFSSVGDHGQSLRLSFAAYNESTIERGLKLLGTSLIKLLG